MEQKEATGKDRKLEQARPTAVSKPSQKAMIMSPRA